MPGCSSPHAEREAYNNATSARLPSWEHLMPNAHPHIPTLDVSGTPGQIGAAHGESQRERIREYADRFLGWLVGSTAVRLSEAEVWAQWSAQVAVNQREAADLIEEMRGIARGSG